MLEIVLQQLRITLVITKLVFMKNKFLFPLGPYTLSFFRQFIWQNTENLLVVKRLFFQVQPQNLKMT